MIIYSTYLVICALPLTFCCHSLYLFCSFTIVLNQLVDIEVLHGDFLKLDAKDPAYSEVTKILCDTLKFLKFFSVALHIVAAGIFFYHTLDCSKGVQGYNSWISGFLT